MSFNKEVIEKVKNTLINASTRFRDDQIKAYENAIKNEDIERSNWVMDKILENAKVANENKTPLCDDTGIPHLFLEVGKNRNLSGGLIKSIEEGVAEGLRELPGRPMAVKGNEIERIEQSKGLYDDPGELLNAPIQIRYIEDDVIRLSILMQGGGPEIRSKTYRVFHEHKLSVIMDNIVNWANEEVGKLGCTPTVPAIGIGRTHYEASSLMIEAMVKRSLSEQNDMEKEITKRINKSNVGPLGLGGNTTALATLLKVGPQRASGVRIVCMRLSCCFEPRLASVEL